jgi:hypothetical protein
MQQPLPEHDELRFTDGTLHEVLGPRNHLEPHPSLDTEVPSSGIQSDARSPSSDIPEIPVQSLPTSGFLDEIPILRASETHASSPQSPKHSETAHICNLNMGRPSEVIFRSGPRRVEAVPFVTRIPIDGPEPDELTYNNESLILYTWEWCSIPKLDLVGPKSNE